MRAPKYSLGSTSERYGNSDPDTIGSWVITFLPKGYGPTEEDKVVHIEPISRKDWNSGYGVRNPAPRVKAKLAELSASLK